MINSNSEGKIELKEWDMARMKIKKETKNIKSERKQCTKHWTNKIWEEYTYRNKTNKRKKDNEQMKN